VDKRNELKILVSWAAWRQVIPHQRLAATLGPISPNKARFLLHMSSRVSVVLSYGPINEILTAMFLCV
jgi:hypothetical protein